MNKKLFNLIKEEEAIRYKLDSIPLNSRTVELQQPLLLKLQQIKIELNQFKRSEILILKNELADLKASINRDLDEEPEPEPEPEQDNTALILALIAIFSTKCPKHNLFISLAITAIFQPRKKYEKRI